MKSTIQIIVLVLSIGFLTGCIDEFNICSTDYGEGNIALHLNTKGKYYTRDGEEESTTGNASKAATDDENYIAVESDDYCFYFFDADTGEFVKEFTPDDVLSKNYDGTGYSFILKVDEGMQDVNIMTLTNLKSYGVDKYPSFAGKTLNDVYTEINNIFEYQPVVGTDEEGNPIYYTWTPNASEGRGIPMFGVSGQVGIRDQVTDVTIPMVRSLAKIEVEYYETKEAIKHDGYAIYVYNESKWDDVYVYPWVNEGEGNTHGLGDIVWPGLAPSGKVVVKGKEYYYYDLGSKNEGETINVILNNGKGFQIDGPQNYRINRDYYLKLTGEIDAAEWEVVDMDYKHVGNTVYVKNETDWEDIYLYAYRNVEDGDNEILGPSWPGRLTGKEIINDETYYFFDLEDITGSGVYFIFNNGRTKQLSEMEYDPTEGAIYDTKYEYSEREGKEILVRDNLIASFISNELYIKLNDDELEISPEGFTIYVKNSTGWEGEDLYLYMYGDKYMEGGAPGMKSQGTKQIAGEEYHYFHLNEDWINLKENLIFSDGNNNQIPAYEFTVSRNNYPGGLYLEIAIPFSNIEVTERELISTEPTSDKDSSNNEIDTSTSEYYTNDKAFRVYVKDETDWEALALYAWGDEEVFGGWSGKQADGKIEIDGEEYAYFELPADIYGKVEHLIFNNNGGGVQLADFDISTCRDYFLNLTTSGVKEITEHPEFKPSYWVYVENNTGWNDVYLYMWGDKELLGGWPGLKGEKMLKDNKEVFGFKLPPNSEGLLENLIFNNNAREQHTDYLFEISGDLSLTIGKKSHDVKYGLENQHESVNINVLNKVGWEAIKVYAYNEQVLGEWNDTDLTYDNNTGYYTLSINEEGQYKDALNKYGILMFHDGSYNENNKIQMGDDPFTFNQDLYVALNRSKKIVAFEPDETVDKEEEDYYFKAVTLSYYNLSGSLIPDLSENKNNNWTITDIGLDTPTIPEDVTNSKNNGETVLYFVWDNRNKLWIAYVPEMDIMDENRPDLHLYMKPFDDENEDQTKDYSFGLDDQYIEKKEGDKTLPEAQNHLKSLIRNTIYYYSAGRNHKTFEIKYTVCPWDYKITDTITFD